MTRIYWGFTCGSDQECCCKCPYAHIDEENRRDQTCCFPYNGLLDKREDERKLNCMSTPVWCPLPKRDEERAVKGIQIIYEE